MPPITDPALLAEIQRQQQLNATSLPPRPIPQLIPKGANQVANEAARIGISRENTGIAAGHLALAKEKEARMAGAGEVSKLKAEQIRASQNAAKSLMSTSVSRLADAYMQLDRLGAVVSEQAPSERNIAARARASGVGQIVEGALGTKAQRYRDRIAQSRPLLVQAIRQATGMSAKAMDSNIELKFYLDAASDPTRNYIENLAAVYTLDKVYGSGGKILEKQLPANLLKEVKRSAGEFGMELPKGARPEEIEPGTIRTSRRTGKSEQWNGTAWVPAER